MLKWFHSFYFKYQFMLLFNNNNKFIICFVLKIRKIIQFFICFFSSPFVVINEWLLRIEILKTKIKDEYKYNYRNSDLNVCILKYFLIIAIITYEIT